MRKAFIKAFTEIAAKNKNVYLLTGDLGFSVFEEFIKAYPNQYINCGVAEQNMVGMAAGLALSGKKVFVYSIIPFATMRPFEQVRNDVCLHNADVKIIGVGGGYSYGPLGATHHSIEDIAIMKALPNMKVIVPADPLETELAVHAIAEDNGPVYLRLGKSREENIYTEVPSVRIGKATVVRNGRDAAIIGSGPILNNILKAVDILAKKNIMVTVIDMFSIKPLDEEIVHAAAKTGVVATVEEHSIIGGLGDSVAAVLAQARLEKKCRFKKIGIHDVFMSQVGDQEYLRSQNGLAPEQLAETVLSLVAEKK